MPSQDVFDRLERDVLPLLPGRVHDLSRLRALAAEDGFATITVIGKYNHGKSRLLNELLGHDAFAVADRRETTRLSAHVQDRVRWLDAPGLDADVGGDDDHLSQQATWIQSDIRLFVHSAKSGELDAQECALLERLRADATHTRRQALLIVSQVDQLADEAELRKVLVAIDVQASGMVHHAVSATRHRAGVEGGKKLLVERSGISALKDELAQATARVPAARAHESAQVRQEIGQELRQRRSAASDVLARLLDRQSRERVRFDADLVAVFDKAKEGLEHIVFEPGPDLALQPDTVADEFRFTVARQARARVQVAYSKVCIHINAVLTRHGANELPAVQHTVAHSLNSVMVAVLGVSVKYRDDLRGMFFESAGRERLAGEFARYFEMSVDRQVLAARIEDAQQSLAAIEQAKRAMCALEVD